MKREEGDLYYKVEKWHKTNGHSRTNLEAYYHKKASKVVPTFQKIWESFIRGHVTHGKSREIIDYLHGANERLKQLIFARDIIEEVLQKKPCGNDIWFITNFHIFHFISLAKSLGDNLAWLVSLYCNMNLDERKTDLTLKAFENNLKAANKRLHDFIYSTKNFPEFRRLKELRDIIHHRHALHVENVKLGFGGPEKVMIPLDPKSGLMIDGRRYRETILPKLAEASDKDSIVKYGLKALNVWTGPKAETPWRELLPFCEQIVTILRELYHSVYQRMLIELSRKPIGRIEKYYGKIGVAIVELTDELDINDKILVEGVTTSFMQSVLSMEIQKKKIANAKGGNKIGLKVNDRVRKGDILFKMSI